MRAEIAETEGRLMRYVHQELAGVRTGLDGLRSEMTTTYRWMIGLVITLVIGLIASQLVGN